MQKILIYLLILSSSVAFAALFAVLFLNGTDMQCVRQTDQTYTCTLQTLLFDTIPTFKREVDQIVDVTTVSDGCSDGCSYRTELIRADGSYTPLTEVYTDASPVERQTTELRGLFRSGKPSFDYHKPPLWWVAYLIGGLFLMEVFILTLVMGGDIFKNYLANRDRAL